MNTTIALMIGSPLSTLSLVEATLNSLIKNIGTKDIQIVVGILPKIDSGIKQFVQKFQVRNRYQFHVLIQGMSWSEFINIAMDRASGSKWFLIAHDDIELLTENFMPRVENIVQTLNEPIGWISFTDKDYINGRWASPTRPGFHKDFLFANAWRRRKIFQYHTLPEKWWTKGKGHKYFESLPFDFPQAPVKCHAPFNHFILIEVEKLKQIGKCENWCSIGLLQDLDSGLRAAKLGLFNIWIPELNYLHNRIMNVTRSSPQINRCASYVHRCFFKKWGFHHDKRVKNEIEKLRREWGSSNVIWSLDRNSYDWEYVK